MWLHLITKLPWGTEHSEHRPSQAFPLICINYGGSQHLCCSHLGFQTARLHLTSNILHVTLDGKGEEGNTGSPPSHSGDGQPVARGGPPDASVTLGKLLAMQVLRSHLRLTEIRNQRRGPANKGV